MDTEVVNTTELESTKATIEYVSKRMCIKILNKLDDNMIGGYLFSIWDYPNDGFTTVCYDWESYFNADHNSSNWSNVYYGIWKEIGFNSIVDYFNNLVHDANGGLGLFDRVILISRLIAITTRYNVVSFPEINERIDFVRNELAIIFHEVMALNNMIEEANA